MTFRELSQAAQLTSQHLAAIRAHSLESAIEMYLASRSFGSVSLASHVVSHLIDSNQLSGHSWLGDSLRQFDSVLADAIARLEANLPEITNPLEVESTDVFAKREFA